MKSIFLVDADDTILDFHGASALALKAAFFHCGIAWQEIYGDVFKTLNDGLWESLERKELTRSELIEKRFPLYLQTLGITSVDGGEFNRQYLHFLSNNPTFVKGAENFLIELGKMGKVYIVTNGTERIQKSRFEISGLWNYIDDAFVSECIGFDKPAKGYTDYVLSHIPNFEKEKAVWIGDSLSADIKAANEAGIESVWFNPKKKALNGKAKPQHIAVSFEEILNILWEI